MKDWLVRDKALHLTSKHRETLLRAVMLCELRLIGFIDKRIGLVITDGVGRKGDDCQIRES